MSRTPVLLTPLLLNPTTLAIGLDGFGLYHLLKDREADDEEASQPQPKALPAPSPTAEKRAIEANGAPQNLPAIDQSPSPEAISNYMSELGKRSAAARAAKRAAAMKSG